MPIQLVQPLARNSRVQRRPQHTFQLRTRPWQIQPFMIAPVLPGETMQSVLLQSRVVTDPIKNPLIGWWCEYYLFYVKHRDLAARDELTGMVLNPDADLSSLFTAAKVEHYHYGSTIDWTGLCLTRVVEEFFRDEGEFSSSAMIGNLPSASINQQSWLDSVTDETEVESFDESLDENADGTVTASEAERVLRHYQFMKLNGLTDMTYEDFLGTYGVNVPPEEEEHKPELIRYVRDWTYPTNHVDPTNGTPSSACSWAIAERADKARFFKEPGFIFGVTVARPKVYLSGQSGSAAGLLNDAFSWLPATLRDDYSHSIKPVAAGSGPLPGVTDGYYVDVKDLFLYGDQFVNFALTATDAGLVALPTAGLEKRFPTAAMADSVFANAAKNLIRQDGVANLVIQGSLTDTTPRMGAAAA